MCGVAGILRLPETSVADGALERMTALVAHRGPDGEGTEYLALDGDATWRVGLGHRRLSILDLSPAGRQPMAYDDGRLWLSYNGEVYNYVELRRELEQLGYAFRTGTDTEVVLAAYRAWGPECLARLRGMWGFLLVDLAERRALLARDRLGIKPLYTTRGPGWLAVASEIKQFRALAGFAPRPNPSAVTDYLATGYERPGSTFFAGVEPLAPGHYQLIQLDTLRADAAIPYWFPERVRIEVTRAEEAARRFRAAFEESVRIHLRSDVPVGCALSGGLDSSSIAALVARQRAADSPPLHTFSVTFPGTPIDERPYIDAVVRSLDARPHFVTPTAEQFLEDLDDFLDKHDEPVGSLSQYAGYAVARLTRAAGVPVTLNGQGGDEVLSGYWQCYFVHLRQLARQGRLARLGGHLVGAMLPGGNLELVRQAPGVVRRYRARQRDAGGGQGPVQLASTLAPEAWRVYEVRELTLPRLLKWDDRNFMAFSVEGRYPLLDHPLIELCLSFAPEVLFRRGWTKHPLRQGLADVLPASIAWRRSKWGFETPQGRWLSGGLAEPLRRLADRDGPVWQYADRGAYRQLIDRRAGDLAWNREDEQRAFRVFLLDRWLARQPAA